MDLYKYIVLANIKEVFEVLGFLLLCGSSFFLIINYDISDAHKGRNVLNKSLFCLLLLSLCLIITSCFIPKHEDFAVMLGWDIAKTKNVQEIVELLKDKLTH